MSLSVSHDGTVSAAIHERGVTASQFSAVAQSYDLARPDYPAACIAEMVESLGMQKESVVVDIGAGTGKLIKGILRHWYPDQADLSELHTDNIYAIEPAHEMHAEFSKLFPNIKIFRGMAENTRIWRKDLADFLVAGTCLHWVDSLSDIARILKPGGGFAIIWNMLDPKDTENEWVADCRNLLEPGGTAKNHDTGGWKKLFKNNRQFTDPEANQKTYTYKIEGTVEDVINCLKSFSAYAKLSPDMKVKYIQGVRDILARHPKTKGKEKIEVPFRVEMYVCQKVRWAKKRSASPRLGRSDEPKRQLIERSFSEMREEGQVDSLGLDSQAAAQKVLVSESIAAAKIDLSRENQGAQEDFFGSPCNISPGKMTEVQGRMNKIFDENLASLKAAEKDGDKRKVGSPLNNPKAQKNLATAFEELAREDDNAKAN